MKEKRNHYDDLDSICLHFYLNYIHIFEMKICTIVETQKDKKCVIFNGYRYLRDRICNVNTYWCCENRSECPGHPSQNVYQIPVVTAEHNHESNEQKIKQKLFKTHLKE